MLSFKKACENDGTFYPLRYDNFELSKPKSSLTSKTKVLQTPSDKHVNLLQGIFRKLTEKERGMLKNTTECYFSKRNAKYLVVCTI